MSTGSRPTGLVQWLEARDPQPESRAYQMSEMGIHIRSAESTIGALRRLADEDLMQLVAGGDGNAFGVLYERHANVAFSLAFRMCGKQANAEEVVQEAFLSMWRGGARYDRTRGSVRTWVLGIVHNRAVDALRRGTVHDRGRVSDEGIEERVQAPDRTDQEVDRRDEAREIRAALEGLPSEQSHVIELAYYGGFTHSEIATMLDIPIGTIKGRMRLGLDKLRTQLAPTEGVQ
jgi:RNA polymerase sigma-70 factor, ECF subfamily